MKWGELELLQRYYLSLLEWLLYLSVFAFFFFLKFLIHLKKNNKKNFEKKNNDKEKILTKFFIFFFWKFYKSVLIFHFFSLPFFFLEI